MATTISNTVAPDASDKIPESLDICGPLPPYRAITGSVIEYIRPANGTNHNGPYQFSIPPDNLRYLQTNFLKLSGKIRIVNKDGTNLLDDADVSPVDFWGQMWINHVSVTISNQLVSDSRSDYGIKTLVQTLLNYDTASAQCRLKSAGFYGNEDEPVAWDATGRKTAWEKVGVRASTSKLKDQFAGSRWNQFNSELNVDMLRTNREWPNSIDLRLSITRKPDNYFIMADAGVADNFRYEIKDLELQVRKVQPNQAVVEANNMAIAKSGAKYQFNRWQQATMPLAVNNKVFNSFTLFRGKIPSKTIYFFVDEEAHSGNYKRNPTLFKHWTLNSFTQNINGVASPSRPQKFEWDDDPDFDAFNDSYANIFDGIGISGMNRGNLLTHDMFKQTRFIMVYDNSPDGSSFYDASRDKPSTGTVSVDFSFENRLPTNVTLVCYGITEDVVMFDEYRRLYLNPVEE